MDFQARLSDPWWRLNNLYWIKDKNGDVVKYKCNWAQALLYKSMWYLNCILKARQLGMTTFIQLFMLDRCLFNDNQNAGIVAHTKEDAEAFFDDKIKFAYDRLPNDIKHARAATSDSKRHLRFSNGSQIRVGTSLRSGTYQYIHVSEFGKLCAKYPDKASEVISGTLNTVAAGNFVFIESTAEGPFGEFYDMCRRSEDLSTAVKNDDQEFTMLDYKFFFFPWYKHPDYALNTPVDIPDKYVGYFMKLKKEHDIELSQPQKWWYVKKAAEQSDKMKQEYPSTPSEAFERSTELAIYGEQLRKAREGRRISLLPIERGIPVNTFWDLGRNDVTAIWFHQHQGAQHRFIYYFEDRLQDLTFYVEQLQKLKVDNKWYYGSHYLPHDVEVTDLSSVNNLSRRRILVEAGLSPIVVVPRVRHINDGIEIVRRKFDACWFDEEGCEIGLRALAGYEWTWDDLHKTTRSTPAHNWASNGADAFRQFAQGYKGPGASFKEQAARSEANLDGSGGRLYARKRQPRRGSVTNPTLTHVV
jgi:hypothetical protein